MDPCYRIQGDSIKKVSMLFAGTIPRNCWLGWMELEFWDNCGWFWKRWGHCMCHDISRWCAACDNAGLWFLLWCEIEEAAFCTADQAPWICCTCTYVTNKHVESTVAVWPDMKMKGQCFHCGQAILRCLKEADQSTAHSRHAFHLDAARNMQGGIPFFSSDNILQSFSGWRTWPLKMKGLTNPSTVYIKKT